jgi:prepilin-type N-terminal cleavage/methylation domain-containing protein
MNEKKTGKGIPMVKLMNKHHQKNIRQFARQPRGFTLTEVMISILIVMVLATGAMGYQ